MSLQLITSSRRRDERRAARYMQEIRDAAVSGLNRRELIRAGLVLGGAGLAMLGGERGFTPHWAHADDLTLISPPNTPFQDPLPIPPVVQPTTLDPGPTKGTNPEGSPLTSCTEVARPDHQKWEDFVPAKQYELIQRAVSHHFYPGVDGVPPATIWAYVDATDAGRYGVLRLKGRYGEPVVVRVHNQLPADNTGFGVNQTSVHLHNAHNASESDGGPTHFFDAGNFVDYHYPNVRAGFARTHPTTTWNGRTVRGDVLETLSTLWFHDHRFDFTAQNVYKGLASFYTLASDDIDLDADDETRGLRLPSGEFDIPLMFTDKVFDPTTGELFFDKFNLDGILGDRFAVNGKLQPYLEVKRRKYRFRLLDAGPSRAYEFFLSNGQSFVQVTNDGNLLPRPLTRKSIRLGVAERVDVIVDFSTTGVGGRVYLQNRLEQRSGVGPTGKIIAPTDLIEFRVVADAPDPSQVPSTLLRLPSRNVPIAKTRTWRFERSGGAWVINGERFDPDAIRADFKQDTAERWILKSGGGWMHPVHLHCEEFQILTRNGGRPPADEVSRKDVVRIGQASVGTTGTGELKFFVQMRDWLGDYPFHCHNTVHEDHAMLLRWQIVP